jgi:hypothetical protein
VYRYVKKGIAHQGREPGHFFSCLVVYVFFFPEGFKIVVDELFSYLQRLTLPAAAIPCPGQADAEFLNSLQTVFVRKGRGPHPRDTEGRLSPAGGFPFTLARHGNFRTGAQHLGGSFRPEFKGHPGFYRTKIQAAGNNFNILVHAKIIPDILILSINFTKQRGKLPTACCA